MPALPPAPGFRWWSLLRRREVLLPTRWGWLLLLLCVVGIGATVLFGLYPFLAPNHPYPTGPVVVDGWVGEEAFKLALSEHRRHGSPALYVVGGPLGAEYWQAGMKDYAELGAFYLHQLGLPSESIQQIPVSGVRKDRTFTSASTLHRWFLAHGGVPEKLTLVSYGPHARRSWMLYQRAFGEGTKVGIMTARDPEYDSARWWTYSQGFRSVVDETIAYLYARLLFWHAEE